MRMLSKVFCLSALILGFNFPGLASTINIPCDFLSISNACMTALEGDVILIGPGNCVMSNTINIDRKISFSIRGSGTNQTTLVSAAGLRQVISIWSNSSNVFSVSDLNCVGAVDNMFGFFTTGGNPPCAPMRGPVHYYNIQMTNVYGRGISMGYGDSFGLIDHCSFKTMFGGSAQPISFGGNSYRSWTNSVNPLGTTNACYVEDCYFDNGTNGGNGFFDAYDGAQLVFRHNFCTGNAPSGVHGYDSQPTSTRTWEIYNNIFTNITRTVLAIELRGGTGVVFSNQVYGASDLCELAYYRSCEANHSGTVNSYGIPGQGKIISFSSNPTDNETRQLGMTSYRFVNKYADNSPWNGVNGYGGGNVVIGATLAETISNLFSAINLGPGAGTTYGKGMLIGHEFIAINYTADTLTLTSALDGNTDAFGYPANQQPGILTSYPLTGTNFVNNQTLWPAYAWGNTLDGVSHDFTLKDDTGACSHYITNLIKLGRDYFNGIAPAPEVYKPLVYPHPLQAREKVNQPAFPPSNLKVVPTPQ